MDSKQQSIRVCHEVLMEDGSVVETEVIFEDEMIRKWQTDLWRFQRQIIERGDMVVGLDIIWRPYSSRSHIYPRYHDPYGLLILCTQIRCIIVRLNGHSQLLQQFFDNKDIIFVGVHVKDVKSLRKLCGLEFRNCVVELSELAADVLHQPRLRALGARLLASEVLLLPFNPRHISMIQANWMAADLTKDQIECATIDAYAAYKTGKKLVGV